MMVNTNWLSGISEVYLATNLFFTCVRSTCRWIDCNASRCACDVKKLTGTKSKGEKWRREERSDDSEIKSAGEF